MSVVFKWDNDKETLLRFVFEEMWQVDDFKGAINYTRHLINDSQEAMDLIIDMSQCMSMPSNLASLREPLQTLNKEHIGVIAFVTQNTYLEKAMLLLNQILHNQFKMYFTDDLDEARKIIDRVYLTRDNRNPNI